MGRDRKITRNLIQLPAIAREREREIGPCVRLSQIQQKKRRARKTVLRQVSRQIRVNEEGERERRRGGVCTDNR